MAPSVSAPAIPQQFSKLAMPQAVVTPPLTAEARVNQPLSPALNTAASSPEKIANPFANSNSDSTPSPAQNAAGQRSNSTTGFLESTTTSSSEVMLTSASEATFSVALEGECPVTLLKETKWVKGTEQHGAMHRGRLYLFATAEAQAEFLREPEAYSPLLSGYDPVIFHEQGRLQDGKKSHGVFMTRGGKQQVVLFESDETRAKFRANPSVYLESIRVAVERADGK
jgi:protein disulfide-isomerase